MTPDDRAALDHIDRLEAQIAAKDAAIRHALALLKPAMADMSCTEGWPDRLRQLLEDALGEAR